MKQIQWYPGHMTKARRMIERNLPLIDVVIEIVDARAPHATRNPDFDDLFAAKNRLIILNKADLADEEKTQEWLKYYQKFAKAITFVATGTERKKAISLIAGAVQLKAEKLKGKGISMTTRALVAGVPNVGKSTFINCLAGSARSQTGDRPGVTKGKQWISISPHLELMDTPGLLWPKFIDQGAAERLAFLGSINDLILDGEELACDLIEFLRGNYPDQLYMRYKKLTDEMPYEELLVAVARSRGFLISGGQPDTQRAASTVLDEFRGGKIGRMTLETPALLEKRT